MRLSLTRALLLLALCLAAFHGVGRNGFLVLDDAEYVTANSMVARGLTPGGVAWAFTTTRAANWHPLTWLSHMLDVELFGMDAPAHHLVSAGLHAGAAVALLAALTSLTGAGWPSFFAAALFAVHPLRVESVAWAAERKDVLCLLLALAALLAYARAARRPAPAPLAAVATLFALAALAKPAAVTLPFLLLLVDHWPLGRWGAGSAGSGAARRWHPPWPLWREKLPLFAIAAAASAATLVAQASGRALAPLGSISLPARLANAVQACAAYLGDTFWPRGLSVLYPHPFTAPAPGAWVGSLLLLAALSAVAWRARRAWPFVAVGWAWFLGALVPMLGLVQPGYQARADRYTYLAHVGLAVAAVWLAAALARRRGRIRLAVAAGAAAVALLAVGAAGQVRVWRTSETLLSRALSLAGGASPPAAAAAAGAAGRNPGLAYLHDALGVALYEEGRLDEAIAHYRAATQADPAFAAAKNNLGRALEETGAPEEARRLYLEAIALDPRFPEPRNNLGGLVLARGATAEAVRLLRQAAELDPLEATIRSNLGAAYAAAGRPADAERELRAAVELAPANEPARFNLGRFLVDAGRAEEAIAHLRESVRLEPRQVEAHLALAEALERAGRGAEAAEERRRGAEARRALEPGATGAAAAGR